MDRQVLVRLPGKGPLQGLTEDEFLERLRETLSGRVEQAWIFGSLAEGDFNRHSDVDIILVKETETPFPDRALEFTDLYDLACPMDILVYTPEEFTRLCENPRGFWRSVTESMERVM
jgi:predicted nucleotidyltransferase